MANMRQTPTLIVSSSNTGLTTVVVALATFSVVALLYRKRSTATSKKMELTLLPPGPAGLPVIGNLHQMLSNKPVFRWIHRLLKEFDTEILCVRLGSVHVIAVTCPEMAREVLRKNDAVFASRPTTFAAESFSVGYRNVSISPFGDEWKRMRRVLTTEILSPSMEHRLHGRRAEEADHIVRYVYYLCSAKPEGTVDVRHVARHFCGNIIRALTFGKRHFSVPPVASDGGPGRDEAEHVDALFTTLNYLDAFCISDYFPALVGLDLDGHEKVIKGVMRTLNRLHDPVIEERMEEWRVLRKGGERREVGDFLDVLVSLEDAGGGPLLTVEEIRAETIDIMIATVDNPSNAVEWVLAEMIKKPQVMQKAMDEIESVVGSDRLVQESDIRQLNYLKACVREAFRIHPYHPFNPPRVAMADTTIAGYSIPKGSQVILCRAGLGRNPKVWDEPLEFRPERHLDDPNVALAEPDLRFISFSTGRRGCPGVSLGTSITMMLCARLLQCFTWSKPPGVDRVRLDEAATSLVLANPLVLHAKPRLPLHLYEAK